MNELLCILTVNEICRCQSEPAIHAMQFLDVITMKDPNQKSNFYRGTLLDALPYIPKVGPQGKSERYIEEKHQQKLYIRYTRSVLRGRLWIKEN